MYLYILHFLVLIPIVHSLNHGVNPLAIMPDDGEIRLSTIFMTSESWCQKTKRIIRQETHAVEKISNVISQIKNQPDLSEEEKTYHVSRFEAFQEELNETMHMIYASFRWMNRTLHGDYKNIIMMKEYSKARLDAIQTLSLHEQQEYDKIIKADENLKKWNNTAIVGMIDEILKDVSAAADKLENSLDEHVFANAAADMKNQEGSENQIQTVIRLNDKDEKTSQKNDSKPVMKDAVIKLVDSQDNQFVLSKGKDTTIPLEDHHFIQDVIIILICAFVLGFICTFMNMPSMFGYISAGLILGPSVLNLIRSLVQVETLGEFGVFFILFAVGLEFSPDTIKQVFKISVFGTILMMFITIASGALIGYFLGSDVSESTFIASCLSLSSTPLVVKFLHTGNNPDGTQNVTEYGSILLGILVMQDVILGLLMGLLPTLSSSSQDTSPTDFVIILLIMSGYMLAILSLTFILARFFIGPIFKILLPYGKETVVLGAVALAMLMLLATDTCKLSMELGCFLAGAIISAQGHRLSHQIETIIQPIKDLLGCIFFTTIGMHIYPSFMMHELTFIITFTFMIVSAKFLISVLVLSCLNTKKASFVKWVVAAGSAQVSEFSFVLSSRARRLGLISREVYLLILSVTTLSLLISPLLWRATLWKFRVLTKISKDKSEKSIKHMPSNDLKTTNQSAHHSDEDDFVIIPEKDLELL